MARSPQVRRIAALAATAAALLTLSVAAADEVVAELARDTPIAAYGGARVVELRRPAAATR